MKKNFTPVPNQLIDSIFNRIKPIDAVILLIIIRLTLGWRKDSDNISYSKFMKYSGITSQSTISNSLVRLEEQNLIIITKRPRVTSSYKLGPAFNLSLNSVVENCTEGPDEDLLQILDNSRKWRSSTPENGQDYDESSPKNGETKYNINLKKTTTKANDVAKFFKDNSIDLELSVAYSAELASFINSNDLDLMYFAWIYDQLKNKSNIDSVGAYFRTIYPLEAYISEYQRIYNEYKPIKVEIVCPVCEKISLSSATCTSCGVDIYGISAATIRREKAIQKLTDEKKAEYEEATRTVLFECKGRPISAQLKKEINKKFGIPVD